MTKTTDKAVVDNDLFNDDSTKPESNWFSFEKVGDTISGELIEVYDHKGKFGDQKIYVIRKDDGDEVNVGLKVTSNKLQIQQLKRADIGDKVGIRFVALVDTGKSNPAKSLEVRVRNVSKNDF